MEWFELVSNYEPTNNPLSTYDQLRLWFDHMRTYVFFKRKATCLYPVWPIESAEESSTEHFLQLAQSLADEKRLQILLYLSKQTRTLTEIQQHVKLAKSTVHHHITTLRRTGMICSHFLDHTTPAYYSLREPFIDGFHQKLQGLLLQKGDGHVST